jgi:diguanylate cyclase (GGDEF)-like protein
MSASGVVLGRTAIFDDLDSDDREAVAARMRTRRCPRGDVLFSEGDPGDEMFVILSGVVSITVKPKDAGEVTLSQITAGNFFGEMSIIEQAPRSATCRAVEDCELLGLRAEDFLDLLDSRPRAAMAVLRSMVRITADRLGNTGSLLSQMVQWGEGARKRAVTDEMTGLFNRRFYDESLDNMIDRARIEGAPVALVMFDLDRFGDLNKNYGQDFGDRLIREAAQVFKDVFEESDFLIRYGGDEFAFVLPGRDTDQAVRRCRRVNEAFRGLRFEEHPDLRLTCSLGLAVIPDQASSLADLKEKADAALYAAKESGRDRTEVAPSTVPASQ